MMAQEQPKGEEESRSRRCAGLSGAPDGSALAFLRASGRTDRNSRSWAHGHPFERHGLHRPPGSV